MSFKNVIATIFCFIILMSCSKENFDQEVLNMPTSSKVSTPESSFLLGCNLSPITIPSSSSEYAILAQQLTGTFWGDNGILDNYFDCVHGTPQVGGSCCGPVQVYLDGLNNTYSYSIAEFESWGPNTAAGQYNYLSNGVCSVAEQEAFIDRIYAAALSSTPPCSGGAYNPVAYQVEWSPLPNPNGMNPGVAMFVKVTYTSFCLFSL